MRTAAVIEVSGMEAGQHRKDFAHWFPTLTSIIEPKGIMSMEWILNSRSVRGGQDGLRSGTAGRLGKWLFPAREPGPHLGNGNSGVVHSAWVCLLVILAGSVANAAGDIAPRPTSLVERKVSDPKPSHDVEPGQAPVVVLEIAERWLADLAERPFQIRLPVDLWAMETRVRGTSETVGHYTIRCVEGEGGLCFHIHTRATLTAETRSRKRAVTIHTTAGTQFRASKRIELRKAAFVTGDTSVDAMQTLSVQSRIEPHARIGRRILVRVARQRMRKARDTVKRVRRHLTEQRIRDAVDRSVEQRTVAAERFLRHVRMVAVWLGWNGNALPLQLRTGENVLRVAYCRHDAPDNGVVFLTVPGSSGALRVGIPISVFHLPATPTW